MALVLETQPPATVQGNRIETAVRLVDEFGNTALAESRVVEVAFAEGSGCSRVAERGEECAEVCDGQMGASGSCARFEPESLSYSDAAARCF